MVESLLVAYLPSGSIRLSPIFPKGIPPPRGGSCRPRFSTRLCYSSSHLGLSSQASRPAKRAKTYNSGYSPVVTHLTTNPPVEGLTYGERTGPGATISPMVVCATSIQKCGIYLERVEMKVGASVPTLVVAKRFLAPTISYSRTDWRRERVLIDTDLAMYNLR